MFAGTWRAIQKAVTRTKSFVGWVDDPYVGDKISTPFRRKIASGELSLILVPLHKLVSVVKDFSFDQIFGAFNYAADFISGILWGYSGSGYNYRRVFWGWTKAGANEARAGIVWALGKIAGAGVDGLRALGGAFKRRL